MLKKRARYFGVGNNFVRRRMKRTTKQYIIVAFICIIIMGGAAAFTAIMVTGQIRDKYITQMKNLRNELEANKKSIYVAITDVNTGDYITAENLSLQTVYTTQPAETFITADDIGKVALINIMTGTQVLKGMLSDNTIASELRELEYNVIKINTNIVNNDTVDVRISFPNGESYVVLSKKVIKGYESDTAICHFWLNEEELLRMSAAIVDASLYPGSSLYVTKYIEPNIQDAAIVNYLPSLSILSLIESDPNILVRATQELNKEVRKGLENRLADNMTVDVSSIAWDINPNIQINLLPTPIPTQFPIPTPSLTDTLIDETTPTDANESGELGVEQSSGDYFYYTQEEEAKEDDVEYGE